MKSVLSRVSCQECPVKSVQQECQGRVSRVSSTRLAKSVLAALYLGQPAVTG